MAYVGLFPSLAGLSLAGSAITGFSSHFYEQTGPHSCDAFLSGPAPNAVLGTFVRKTGSSAGGGGSSTLAVEISVLEGKLKVLRNASSQKTMESLLKTQLRLLKSAVRASPIDQMPPELRTAVIDAANSLENAVREPADTWKISEHFQDDAYDKFMDVWMDMARDAPSAVTVILLTKTLWLGNAILYFFQEKDEFVKPSVALKVLQHLLGEHSPVMWRKLAAFLENEAFDFEAIQDAYDIIEIVAVGPEWLSLMERLIASMPEPKSDPSHEWARFRKLLPKLVAAITDLIYLEDKTLTELESIFGVSDKKDNP